MLSEALNWRTRVDAGPHCEYRGIETDTRALGSVMKTHLFVVGVVVLLAACSSSGSTGPSQRDAAIGAYSLTKYNGSPLPGVNVSNGVTTVITEGTLTLNPDYTYSIRVSGQSTYLNQTTQIADGTLEAGRYDVEGARIAFRVPAPPQGPSEGLPFTQYGVINGSNINYSSYVFTRK